ncbi:MAG: hypothetical protein KAH57_01560 [Thermoplasmata archaeon]|nr:hypothetical protein [Thermoplasmata archaeon]
MMKRITFSIYILVLSMVMAPLGLQEVAGLDDVEIGATRSEGGTASSFIVDHDTMDLMGKTGNISWDGGIGLSMERNEPVLLDHLEVSHLTTFEMGNGRSIQEQDGTIYLAYIKRDIASDWISFWLILYYEDEGVWDIPVLVNNYTSASRGRVNLLIHDDKIFYLMHVHESGGKGIINAKWAPTSNWYDISGAELANLDSSIQTLDMIDLVGHGQKVFAFWTRDTGSGYFSRFDVANRVWNNPTILPFNVDKIAAFSSDITGSSAIYVVYQRPDDHRLNISFSTNDGAGWSPSQLITDSGNGFGSISVVECQGSIHISLLYEDNNWLAYTRSTDGSSWDDIRTLKVFTDNGLDGVPLAQISGDRSQIVIAYEDGGGSVATLLSEDGGDTFQDWHTYGNGASHCPSFDLDKGLFTMMNGTSLEMRRFMLSGSADLRTIPLTSAGLSSWIDLGIELEGLGDLGSVQYRVMSGRTGDQIHPPFGYIDITHAGAGMIDGREYDIVTDLEGDWTEGAALVDNIIIDLHLGRDPDHQMTFIGMVVNFSTSFPMDINISGGDLVALSQNCDVTPGGVVLDSSFASGIVVIGPIIADSEWPDVLGIAVTSNYGGSTARVELLNGEMATIPGFGLSASSRATNMGTVNYIKWNDRNLRDVPITVEVLYIKVVLFAGSEGASPSLTSLKLTSSLPPTILSVEYPDGEIFRGEQAEIIIRANDLEDPEEDLTIQLLCNVPGEELPSDDLVSDVIWTGNHWSAILYTDPTVPTGTYTFWVEVTDTCGISSIGGVLEGGISVRNVPPDPPSIHASPPSLRVDSKLSVLVDIQGSDLESDVDDLSYIYRYYNGGALELEAAVDSLYHEPDGLTFVKGEMWTILVSTFDTMNESESARLEMVVMNTAPSPAGTIPEMIEFNEDEASGTFDAGDWFVDLDGDTLTFEMAATDHISIVGEPGSFHLTADLDFGGTGTLNVKASDGEGNFTLKIPISVVHLNDLPLIFIEGNVTVEQGDWTYIDIKATDISDNDLVAVSSDILDVIPNITVGVNLFTYPNGSMNFKPTNDMVGIHTISVTATDGTVNVTREVTVTVLNVNKGPANPSVTMDPNVRFAREDAEITFRGSSDDEDLIWGDSLTYSWNSSLDGSLGEGEEITPTLSVGEHLITLTVTDSEGETNTTSFEFTVEEVEGAQGEVMRTTVLIAIVIVIGFLIGTLIGIGIAFSRKKKGDSEEEASSGDDNKDPGDAEKGEEKAAEGSKEGDKAPSPDDDGEKAEKEEAPPSEEKR